MAFLSAGRRFSAASFRRLAAADGTLPAVRRYRSAADVAIPDSPPPAAASRGLSATSRRIFAADVAITDSPPPAAASRGLPATSRRLFAADGTLAAPRSYGSVLPDSPPATAAPNVCVIDPSSTIIDRWNGLARASTVRPSRLKSARKKIFSDTSDWRTRVTIKIDHQLDTDFCVPVNLARLVSYAYYIKNGVDVHVSAQAIVHGMELDSACSGNFACLVLFHLKRHDIFTEDQCAYIGSSGDYRVIDSLIASGVKPQKLVSGFRCLHNPTVEDLLDLAKAQPVLVPIRTNVAFHEFKGDLIETHYKPDPEDDLLGDALVSNTKEPEPEYHCVILHGSVLVSGNRYLAIQNSWGEDWGTKGMAYIAENVAAGWGMLDHACFPQVTKVEEKE